MKLRTLVVGIGALLIPALTWAADGTITRVDMGTAGAISGYHLLLCDSKTSASTTCAETDILAQTPGAPKIHGLPYAYALAIDKATDCSGSYEATVSGANTPGGTAHEIVDLDSTTSATTIVGPPPRYLSVALSTMTDCSDFDLSLILYYEAP